MNDYKKKESYIFSLLVDVLGPFVANNFNDVPKFERRVLTTQLRLPQLEIVLIAGERRLRRVRIGGDGRRAQLMVLVAVRVAVRVDAGHRRRTGRRGPVSTVGTQRSIRHLTNESGDGLRARRRRCVAGRLAGEQLRRIGHFDGR